MIDSTWITHCMFISHYVSLKKTLCFYISVAPLWSNIAYCSFHRGGVFPQSLEPLVNDQSCFHNQLWAVHHGLQPLRATLYLNKWKAESSQSSRQKSGREHPNSAAFSDWYKPLNQEDTPPSETNGRAANWEPNESTTLESILIGANGSAHSIITLSWIVMVYTRTSVHPSYLTWTQHERRSRSFVTFPQSVSLPVSFILILQMLDLIFSFCLETGANSDFPLSYHMIFLPDSVLHRAFSNFWALSRPCCELKVGGGFGWWRSCFTTATKSMVILICQLLFWKSRMNFAP